MMSELNAIKAWPVQDRPRERLLSLGASVLTDAELVAILLGTGTAKRSAVFLAQHLLQEFGGLGNLGRLTPARLSVLSGVGPAKAARLLAACEVGRRRERKRTASRCVITGPADAAQLATTRLRDLTRECCMALYLDTKHRLLKEEIISIGSLDQAAIHPRELFKTALEISAAAVILAHNHPSGDPSPSASDMELTRQLVQAAKLLGICLLDHVIIGDGEYRSLLSDAHLISGGEGIREPKGNDVSAKSSSVGLRRFK